MVDKYVEMSICFCVWNEEKNIVHCIQDALEHLPKFIKIGNTFEILIIDNASTDSTPEVVRQLFGKDSRVRLIRHPKNYLYSGSHRTAFKEAIGRYIFVIDGDFIFSLFFINNNSRLFC